MKDKKAKAIPGAKNKVADTKKARLKDAFKKKYGQRESISR